MRPMACNRPIFSSASGRQLHVGGVGRAGAALCLTDSAVPRRRQQDSATTCSRSRSDAWQRRRDAARPRAHLQPFATSWAESADQARVGAAWNGVPAPPSERSARAEARAEARQGTPQRGLFSAAKQHAPLMITALRTHQLEEFEFPLFFLNIIQNQAPQFSCVPLYSFGKSFSLQSHSEWFVLCVKYVQHVSSWTWPPIFFATGLLFCVHTKAIDQNGYHLLLSLQYLTEHQTHHCISQ
jgi:hypothetical protein